MDESKVSRCVFVVFEAPVKRECERGEKKKQGGRGVGGVDQLILQGVCVTAAPRTSNSFTVSQRFLDVFDNQGTKPG